MKEGRSKAVKLCSFICYGNLTDMIQFLGDHRDGDIADK